MAPGRLSAPERIVALVRGLARQPLALAALVVLLYGVNTTDFDDFARITRDPFVTHPEVTRQFLHSSPLTLFMGWPLTRLFGAGASYAAVSVLGVVVLAIGAWLYLRGRSPDQRRIIGLVFLSTPLLLVLCRWLGKSDTYLLGFYVALLACRGRGLLRAGLALLLVLAHREIGLIILSGDAILRRRLDGAAALGAGVAVALVALYHAKLSVPPFSRVDLALSYLKRGLLGWIRVPVAHLLLAFGWFWMVLVARGRTADLSRVALVILLCFALAMDGADFTRDFILCATPLVAYTAEAAAADERLGSLLTRWPFPLPFLIQLQLESFDQVSDSQWPAAAAAILARLFHHGS